MIAPTGEGSERPAPGFPRVLAIPAPAARLLRKLPAPAGADVLAALQRYAATGAGDVIRLVGVRPPQYRLRVGDYRARFTLTGTGADAAVVLVWVGDRREAY